MQFSDAATKQGIVEEIDALCDSDSTSYPIESKTRRVNAALEQTIGKIIGLDGTWQFDDSNFSDLPIGSTDLVDSQQDYSFDVAMLNIERVEVLDHDAHWHELTPIDKSQIDVALPEYQNVPGLPCEYDKQGASIFLYPAPATASVTLSAGLKVYFQRTASLFTTADTTKTPGFTSTFHIILAYMAAIPYCMTYKKDRVALYQAQVTKLEKDLLTFYAKREKDVRKQITTKKIAFR
jgi:hypothetical protein